MIKREARFQTQFNKWLTKEFKETGVFELKHTHGKDSLPFNAVKDHQLRALSIAKHGVFSYKISDFDMIGFKPFDCFCVARVMAYVVIKYPDFFCLIDIDDFIKEKGRSKRKSLTSDRAQDITPLIFKN